MAKENEELLQHGSARGRTRATRATSARAADAQAHLAAVRHGAQHRRLVGRVPAVLCGLAQVRAAAARMAAVVDARLRYGRARDSTRLACQLAGHKNAA